MKKKITQLGKLFALGMIVNFISTSSLSAQTNITIEAESSEGALYYAQISNTLTGFSGGAGLIELKSYYGSRAQYEVSVPQAGTYDLAIYYGTMDVRFTYVKINDQISQVVKFDKLTGSWNGEPGEVENEEGEMEMLPGVEVKTIQIYLEAGENLLEVGAFEGFSESKNALYGEAPNIDKFVITTSASSIEKPQDQMDILELMAASADKLNGNAKIGSNMVAYKDGKGVVDLRSSDKSYFRFNTIDIADAGTYDVAVYYTTMNKRSGYLKINNQSKNIMSFDHTTSTWGAEIPDDTSKPAVFKKVFQTYFDKGNNTLEFGANDGWAPNVERLEIIKSGISIEKPGPDVLACVFSYTNLVGTEFKEGTTTSKENLDKLFDDNEYTYYELAGASTATIEAKTAYPIILTGYAVASSYENPVNTDEWMVEYSLDEGKTWLPVAKRGNTLNAHYNLINTSYSPLDETPVATQYFRLTATGTSNIKIGEWQLFGVPFISAENNFPESVLTNVENLIASEDGFNRGGTWNEVFENSIDRNAKTKYTVVDKTAFDLTYEFDGAPVEVKSYSLTVPYTTEYMDRNPNKWTLSGFSDELGEWVLLHEVKGIDFPTTGSTLMFNIAEPTPCLAYMLSVTSTAGASTIHLLQWQMFAESQILEPSGIENEVSDDTTISVFGSYGLIGIQVTDADNLDYSVYSITGQTVAKGVSHIGLTEVNVSAGIYIVKVGQTVKKVIVK